MQKSIFILASVLLIAACHSHPDAGGLTLNNGEKWKVNAEMKPHIEQGNAILNAYLRQNSTYHKALAEALKNQNDNLIKSCTMKGKSHDELHKWLHPHIKLVEKLSKTDDSSEAAALVAQIEKSFRTYENYFE